MTECQPIKTRSGKWTIASYYNGKWWVNRSLRKSRGVYEGRGVGSTPQFALDGAYQDNGCPCDVWDTKREVLKEITLLRSGE